MQQLENQLARVISYLEEREQSGAREVIPVLVAQRLALPTPAVLGLLMLLEDRGALQHHYRIYCKRDDCPLLDVNKKSDIPTHLYCKFCDRDHSADDLEVEVFFTILPGRLAELARERAVA